MKNKKSFGNLALIIILFTGANAAYGIINMTIETSEWLRGLGTFFSFITVLVYAVWKIDDLLN